MSTQAGFYDDTQTRVTWDRSAFEEFQARRDAALVTSDAKRLKKLFAAAASPLAREVFDWATKNNVTFFIDHTCEKAGAYYTVGTGTVGLGARYADMPDIAIPMLVHEIRHAWQDQQGMIPTKARNFAEYMIQVALIEADAAAFQRATERQEDRIRWQEEGVKPLPHPDVQADLRRHFADWRQRHGAFYGNTAVRHFAHKLGVPDVAPVDFKTQFRPYGGVRKVPAVYGIPTALDRVIDTLGKTFDGKNYLDHDSARTELAEKFLKPKLAHRFFQSAQKIQPLVTEVNKRLTAKQRDHRKKTGGDFYL